MCAKKPRGENTQNTRMNKRQTCNIISPFIAKGKQYDNFDNSRKQPMKPNLGSN